MKKAFQVVLAALMLLTIGCSTTNTVPTKLNRAINVREEITPLGKDKYRIKLYGFGLFNRAGTIETFHIEAEKLFPNLPYSYVYEISKEALVFDRLDSEQMAIMAYQHGAIPIATLALLEMTTPDEQFVIEGVVEPVRTTKLDKQKSVEILIPKDQKFKGKMLEGSGLAIAERTKEKLEQFFDAVKLTDKPGGADYTIIPSVIRWQDYKPISGLLDIATIEYDIVDSKNRVLLTRFFISNQEKLFTWEKTFSLIPKNYSPDVLIAKPLMEKLNQYLDVN